MKLLVAAHLIGNALLLLLGYYWLGLPESNGFYLVYSTVIVLLCTLGALWLHGSAFVYFRQSTNLAFRNLLPLFLFTLVVGIVYLALDRAYFSFGHEAFVIGSYSTMKLRRPVAPSGVLQAFHVFITIVRWLVVPVLALPLASEIASHGWHGFRMQAFQPTRRWLFWVQCCALLLLALWVPFKLFFWIPTVPNFVLEMISVALRIGIGYLLFVTSLLALEFCTSRKGDA